jgi:hypothetical protein
LKNNAGLWSLNFLVAVGLISIILFGFFVLMSVLRPADIADVKASVAEINTGSQLINFFRIPVNNQLIADLTCEHCDARFTYPDCSDLRKALIDFYGKDVNCKLTVDEVKKCSRGDLGKKPIKLDLVLPDYDGKLHNLTLEVNYEIAKK